MSNTGRNKKLASFNCDQELWTKFMRRCQEKGTTATATLTRVIELYLDGSLDDLDVYPGNTLESRLDERVRASVDDYLKKHLPFYLDKYLATYQGNWTDSTVVALSEKIESLESRLEGQMTTSNTTKKTRTSTQSANSKKEREFWFIQERVKHLGLTINADQRLKIEMFANDAFKERHGQLPKRQPFRGTQAFAYPASDLDILDTTIKGVVAGA